MMAKKGLDTGDDMDRMPDSIRYLAIQAMHEGRPIPQFMGRPGQPVSYGSGNMFMGGDINNSGKVGKSCPLSDYLGQQLLTVYSHSSFHLPFFEHWKLAKSWSKCYGSCCLLFARQGLHYLLH